MDHAIKPERAGPVFYSHPNSLDEQDSLNHWKFCRKIIKLLVGNYLDRTALVQSGANLKLPTGSLTQRYITDQSFLHSPSRLPIIRNMIVATCSSHGQASLSNVFSHCRSLTPLKRPRAARHRHAPWATTPLSTYPQNNYLIVTEFCFLQRKCRSQRLWLHPAHQLLQGMVSHLDFSVNSRHA